jgi:hypothetical protein
MTAAWRVSEISRLRVAAKAFSYPSGKCRGTSVGLELRCKC